jgi:hypothetical protein
MIESRVINTPDGDVTIHDVEKFCQAATALARILESYQEAHLIFNRADGVKRLMRATRVGMSPWIWDGESLSIPVRDLALDEIRAFRFDRLIRFKVDGPLAE